MAVSGALVLRVRPRLEVGALCLSHQAATGQRFTLAQALAGCGRFVAAIAAAKPQGFSVVGLSSVGENGQAAKLLTRQVNDSGHSFLLNQI